MNTRSNTRALMSFRNAVALAAAVAVSGCATFDPLTAIGIPPLKPVAQAGAGSAAPAAGPVVAAERPAICRTNEFAAPIDVDTAYARVMSRVRFRTADERKIQVARNRLDVIDPAFRHIAQPASYYRMADVVATALPSHPRSSAWLEMELIRDGAARTRVKTEYCLGGRHPQYSDPTYGAGLDKLMYEAVTK